MLFHTFYTSLLLNVLLFILNQRFLMSLIYDNTDFFSYIRGGFLHALILSFILSRFIIFY